MCLISPCKAEITNYEFFWKEIGYWSWALRGGEYFHIFERNLFQVVNTNVFFKICRYGHQNIRLSKTYLTEKNVLQNIIKKKQVGV